MEHKDRQEQGEGAREQGPRPGTRAVQQAGRRGGKRRRLEAEVRRLEETTGRVVWRGTKDEGDG